MDDLPSHTGPGPGNLITDVAGLKVGQADNPRGRSGPGSARTAPAAAACRSSGGLQRADAGC